MSDSSISEQWRRAEALWPTAPHGFIADDPFWTVNEDGSRTISLRPAPAPRRIPWWRRMLRRFTPWWIVALSPLLILPIGLAAPARADSIQDYAYIATLDEFGVYYSSETAAIALGHNICQNLDSGVTAGRIARFILDLDTDIEPSVDDVNHLIGAAIGAYCPDHDPSISGGVLR